MGHISTLSDQATTVCSKRKRAARKCFKNSPEISLNHEPKIYLFIQKFAIMKPKHFTLIFIFLFTCIIVHAQTAEKFSPQRDQKIMNGYTIHLTPAFGNTLGFAIMKGNKPVWSQPFNPLSAAPTGFKNKEDAYKVAEWIITKGIKNGIPQKISPSDLKQLNLSTQMPDNSSSLPKK